MYLINHPLLLFFAHIRPVIQVYDSLSIQQFNLSLVLHKCILF
uniref:Uncharacterized protein n=1 Tax=Heterorhabditis bacteriophora TaxID=37862 RepID=A0A1I7WYW4_HETBA